MSDHLAEDYRVERNRAEIDKQIDQNTPCFACNTETCKDCEWAEPLNEDGEDR